MLALLLLALGATPPVSAPCAIPDTLEQLEQRVREAGEVEARIAALTEVAGMQPAGEAPTAEITRVVALGLDDEAREVRMHAARLLGPEQHAETAGEALVRACRATTRSWNEAAEKLVKHFEKMESVAERHRNEPLRKRMAAASKLSAETEPLEASLDEASAELGVLAQSLGAWKDDRAVEALCELARSVQQSPLDVDGGVVWVGDLEVEILTALLSLGSRDAVLQVADVALAWSERVEDFDRRIRELKRKKEDVWDDFKASAMESLLDVTREHQDRIGGLIRAFATEHSLPRPVSSRGRPAVWNQWKRKVERKLPASLGPSDEDE